MKKLIGILGFIVFVALFTAPSCYAGASFRMEEHEVKPASKKEQTKAVKKLVKELRKEYHSEMKGMSLVEKKAFIQDKIKQNQLSGNFRYLILALICFLVAGVAWVLPPVLDWLVSTIFGIIGVILLVIWLLNILENA
jgi:Flp pilus assembly protein TadB